MFFTYSVIYHNSFVDKFFEEHGIVMASSFKEAYEKIEEDFGKNLEEIHLVMHDNDEANTIQAEVLNIALDGIEPLSVEKYNV